MSNRSDDQDDDDKKHDSGFWAAFFDALSWLFVWTALFGD